MANRIQQIIATSFNNFGKNNKKTKKAAKTIIVTKKQRMR